MNFVCDEDIEFYCELQIKSKCSKGINFLDVRITNYKEIAGTAKIFVG